MNRPQGRHINGPDLLAYLDGELNAAEAARVEAHLATCPDCAAELAELRFVRDGLEATIPPALAGVSLSPTAADRVRERLQRARQREQGPLWETWWWLVDLGRRLSRQWVVAAYAALALLVIGFGLSAHQSSRVAETGDEQETLVLAQGQFAPGSQAAVRILVRDVNDAEPVAGAQVSLRVGRTPGLAQEVFSGQTDQFGTADIRFEVPENVTGDAALIVETRSNKGEDTITQPIHVARQYRLLVSSDKPAYQPGQTIHLRALALGAVDNQPAVGEEIGFVVLSPGGDKLTQRTLPASDYGIAALEFPLDEQAPEGVYTLQAALGDTVSERTVTVRAYALPRFEVTVETDRTFYQPGDPVAGTLEADYFFDKPVVGGQVTLRGYVYGVEREQVIELYGWTDETGRFEFGFDLPKRLLATEDGASAQFGLEAQVVDAAGQSEITALTLPISEQLIHIEAVPESGRLEPGLENIVYLLTSYPDGQPAQTTLTVRYDDEQSELQTDPFGLAQYRLVPPQADVSLSVSARDPFGAQAQAHLPLQRDTDDLPLLLRAERATYRVGQTLRLEALVGPDLDGRAVYLDLVKEGQPLLSTSAPVEAGRARFAVDLDEATYGTLELQAYLVQPDGQIVRDTRLVIVDAPRQIQVAVSADQPVYQPGQTAQLDFRTTLSQSTNSQSTNSPPPPLTLPVQAALGIGVVDQSVYALEEQTPGFAQLYFLLEKELLDPRYQAPGLSLPALFPGQADADLQGAQDTALRQAQDTAVKAAWADAPASRFPPVIRSYADKLAALITRELNAMRSLSRWLSRALVGLPLLLALVTGAGLRSVGVLAGALRRVGKGLALLILASPVIVPGAALTIWLTWKLLGPLALALTLVIWLAAWAGFTLHAWRAGDQRAQVAAGLALAYLLLGGVMTYVAANDGDLTQASRLGVALAYLLTLLSLVTFGQGLIVGGSRWPGWAATALGLLLVPMTVFVATLPGLSSEFARTLGSPTVYSLPSGLLTGCGGSDEEFETVIVEKTVVQEKTVVEKETVVEEGETVVQEKTVVEEKIVVVTATPEPAPQEPTQPPPAATPLPSSSPAAEPTQPTVEFEPTEAVEPGEEGALEPAPLPTAAAPTEPPPAEPPRLRQFFPETLYWAAEVLTDETGRLSLALPLADSITTWRLTALASSQNGELGAASYDLQVFQDFFLDLDLPPSLTQGDVVRLPVTVYNYLPQPQTVQLSLESDDWIQDPATHLPIYQTTLTIDGNDLAVAYFTIQPQSHGLGRLTLTAKGENRSDALSRQVRVEPNGFEQRESLSDRLGHGAAAQIQFPDEAITGTQRLEVRLFAGGTAPFVQGREALLAHPAGGLEQVLATHYANVLILGQASDDQLRLQAEQYVATGYQRLLSFELPGGGFAPFGDTPYQPAQPDLRLTAQALMGLAETALVHPVDPAVLRRTADWIFETQASDGSWASEADRPIPLTAYVTWALVESSAGAGQNYAADTQVQFGLNHLERHLDQVSDPYSLALVANALVAADPQTKAAQGALDHLADQATRIEGAAYWESQAGAPPSLSGATGPSRDLETNALATLALLRSGDERLIELAQAGLTGLIRAQDEGGGWHTPQASALALKAFNQALSRPQPTVDASLELELDGQTTHRIVIGPDETGVVRTLYLDDVGPGAHSLRLTADGATQGLTYQIVAVYHLPWDQLPPPPAPESAPVQVAVSYDRTRLLVDETVTATLQLSQQRPADAGTQQAVVELGLPPGFEVVPSDLSGWIAQTADQPTRLRRYQIVGRRLTLYLESLPDPGQPDQARRTIRLSFRLQARLVTRAQTGPTLAYDPHNPTQRAVHPPTEIIVQSP